MNEEKNTMIFKFWIKIFNEFQGSILSKFTKKNIEIEINHECSTTGSLTLHCSEIKTGPLTLPKLGHLPNHAKTLVFINKILYLNVCITINCTQSWIHAIIIKVLLTTIWIWSGSGSFFNDFYHLKTLFPQIFNI